MKLTKVIAFLLLFLFIGSLMAGTSATTTIAAPAQQDEGRTVWEVIQAEPELSGLETLIAAAGLVDNLHRDGPFTVFAPSDAALVNLEAMVADSDATLTEILLYHIVNGDYNGPQVADEPILPTLLGEQIDISVERGQIVLNDTTEIIQTDLEADNGTVHIVNALLIPPANSLITAQQGSRQMTLAEVLEDDGRFETFLRLSREAELDQLDDTAHPYTLFVPTDEAFAQLSEAQFNDWLTNQEATNTLLSYHLVPGQLGINQIVTADAIASEEGRLLHVDYDEETSTVTINGQPLQAFNILAANGVIHVVDQVLFP